MTWEIHVFCRLSNGREIEFLGILNRKEISWFAPVLLLLAGAKEMNPIQFKGRTHLQVCLKKSDWFTSNWSLCLPWRIKSVLSFINIDIFDKECELVLQTPRVSFAMFLWNLITIRPKSISQCYLLILTENPYKIKKTGLLNSWKE